MKLGSTEKRIKGEIKQPLMKIIMKRSVHKKKHPLGSFAWRMPFSCKQSCGKHRPTLPTLQSFVRVSIGIDFAYLSLKLSSQNLGCVMKYSSFLLIRSAVASNG